MAYNILVPTARTCLVSFTDSNGIRHGVEGRGPPGRLAGGWTRVCPLDRSPLRRNALDPALLSFRSAQAVPLGRHSACQITMPSQRNTRFLGVNGGIGLGSMPGVLSRQKL